MLDVLIVGGGPGGLSCALLLARCGHSVLVCDDGCARNLQTDRVNGYLGAANCSPVELRSTGHRQLAAYETVQVREASVASVEAQDGRFSATLGGGETVAAQKLVLATGLRDELPDWPGVKEHYGRGVYTCPYCDAWERRDQPITVYGRGAKGYRFALHIRHWTPSVTLCSDGPADLPAAAREELEAQGISLEEGRVARVVGSGSRLEYVELASGSKLKCSCLFLASSQAQHSDLARQIGCKLDDRDLVVSDERGCTSVPGLFVVGDDDTFVGTQMAIVAAADGARVGQSVHQELFRAKLGKVLEAADWQ